MILCYDIFGLLFKIGGFMKAYQKEPIWIVNFDPKIRPALILFLIFSLAILSSCKNTGTTEFTPQAKQIPTDSEFEQIDKHALNAPKSVEHSLEKLTAYLIAPAKNEREKARAIYRWITNNIAYDDASLFSGTTTDNRVGTVLQTHRAVCDGYAGLFKDLAQLAGLEVAIISGYSKGYSYVIDDADAINHAWNAVKIEGQWQLFDATWGAGYLDDKQKRFVRQFQDHYFLTPPEQLIYDHFPKQTKWQLLTSPISKSQYDRLVYLRPAFFKTGLAIGTHPYYVIKTKNQIKITLHAPRQTAITVQLLEDNYQVDQSHTTIHYHDDKYDITATFPRQGQYTLRLFAKPQNALGSYHWALDYRILASQGMQSDEQIVLPEQAFFDNGLTVDSHPHRLIEAQQQIQITILAPDNVLMSAVLYQNRKRLDKTFTFVQRKEKRYEIHAIFKTPGDYLLRLFAKDAPSSNYLPALDYDVKASQGMPGNVAFPKATALFKENNGYLEKPKNRYLTDNSTQTFKLAMPTAEKVAVIVGDQWFHLQKQDGFFIGDVKISQGKISVYAKLPGNKRYGSLLEYVTD
jgi:transglutaminase/protease-like cytokinesis protein 3